MTVIELIQREHDEIADLFDHLVVLARDHRRVDEATRVAARLAAVVRIHSRTEERTLYETLRTRDPALRAAAYRGPHEHELLDMTLDKLLVRRAGDDDYRAIVSVARGLFEHHARDTEEREILPLVAASLSEDELRTLATDMLADQARIRPQVLRLVGMPAQAA